MKKGTIILITMLAAAAVAIGFGVYVIHQRINTQPITQNTPPPNPTPAPTPDPTAPADTSAPLGSTDGWKTYTNTKHGFTVEYPTNLQAGAVSSNSVLGTFDVPVRGLHVGPLVLIALEDSDLKKQAQDYFNSLYQAALNPPANPAPSASGAPAAPECTVDKITNPNVVSIQSVSCNGEGGAAKYAYITGKTYDVFVDGYSKGFDPASSGDFANTTDYATILSTFIFTKDGTASTTTTANSPTPSPTPQPTPNPSSTNPSPAPAPNPNPTSSVQTFAISADDSSATPNMIMVPAGTIVEITFNVASENVYHGGLDFRSSVTNTGTVFAGQSKTISFTASNSFDFTPYWPSSNIAKPYKVSVMVQ